MGTEDWGVKLWAETSCCAGTAGAGAESRIQIGNNGEVGSGLTLPLPTSAAWTGLAPHVLSNFSDTSHRPRSVPPFARGYQ